MFGGKFGVLKITQFENEPDNVFIMSPFKHVLEYLKGEFPSSMGTCEIQNKPNSEYPWRTKMRADILPALLAHLADTLTYTSFSNAAMNNPPDEIVAMMEESGNHIKDMMEDFLDSAAKSVNHKSILKN
jgi:hypothetical protein